MPHEFLQRAYNSYETRGLSAIRVNFSDMLDNGYFPKGHERAFAGDLIDRSGLTRLLKTAVKDFEKLFIDSSFVNPGRFDFDVVTKTVTRSSVIGVVISGSLEYLTITDAAIKLAGEAVRV